MTEKKPETQKQNNTHQKWLANFIKMERNNLIGFHFGLKLTTVHVTLTHTGQPFPLPSATPLLD